MIPSHRVSLSWGSSFGTAGSPASGTWYLASLAIRSWKAPTSLCNEHGDKIAAEDKSKIEEAVAALKKAMEGNDPDAIESATQTLTSASHKLAEEMYKKASASATPGAGETAGAGESPNGAKTDEKVVDAEFEEVDRDKK